MKLIPGTGFPFQQLGDGLCVTPLDACLPGDHFAWWVNPPEFPPFLADGPQQKEGEIFRTPGSGSQCLIIFPTTDQVDGLFVHRLTQWSPYYPTQTQLALRRRKPPAVFGEIDLLQLAFQLSDCFQEPDVSELYLDFAKAYGPLGTAQLPAPTEGVSPKVLIEDRMHWVLEAHCLQEVFGLWLQESVQEADILIQLKMEQLVAPHLGSVALYPVKAGRKGGRTYRTVPRSLIAALWGSPHETEKIVR